MKSISVNSRPRIENIKELRFGVSRARAMAGLAALILHIVWYLVWRISFDNIGLYKENSVASTSPATFLVFVENDAASRSKRETHAVSGGGAVALPPPPRRSVSSQRISAANPLVLKHVPNGSIERITVPNATASIDAKPSSPVLQPDADTGEKASDLLIPRGFVSGPLLAERAETASRIDILSRSDQFGRAIAKGAKSECEKGEYFGSGAGLYSLPFLAAALVLEKCAR